MNAGGRSDVVVWMADAIYVMELKVNGTATDALQQINEKNYSLPYRTDGRRIVKIGIGFSIETKTIKDWVVQHEE